AFQHHITRNRMKLRLLALAAAMAVGASAISAPAVAAPRGFTVEDMVSMERVGTPGVSPDGTRIVYTVRSTDIAKNKGHTGLYLACTKSRLDAREKDKASGKLYDHLFVRHWDTWADGRNAVLFSAPFDGNGRVTGAPVSLSGTLDGDVPSKPFGDREEFRFSPDGKTVVFSVRIAGNSEAWSTNFDLYTVPAAGGQNPRNLTADNPAWDTKSVFSPNGGTIAYLAMTRPGFEA